MGSINPTDVFLLPELRESKSRWDFHKTTMWFESGSKGLRFFGVLFSILDELIHE